MRNVDRTGIEIIGRDECLELLSADQIGRLAVLEGGQPLILPINYGLDDESVVFLTSTGAKLDAARRAPACFEIDGFDRATRSGWSVVVRGRLEEVTSVGGRPSSGSGNCPSRGPKEREPMCSVWSLR